MTEAKAAPPSVASAPPVVAKKEPSTWTSALRDRLQRGLPLRHLLPDRQPIFVG